MKLKLMTVTLLIASLLTACSGKSTDEGTVVKEKQPSDIKELVADYSAHKIKDQNASITSQQLIVTKKNGKETTYDLPKDQFFVSIAPYNQQTHP